MNKARLESFRDGVFAFAIMLLVLGIPIPDWAIVNDPQLRNGLVSRLISFLPYITSFATIGVIWLNRHAVFHTSQFHYAPANATISATIRSTCVYGRAWAAFS
jgi:uncharacterized membrane protein